MSGTLYVISTPIGNLADLTTRAAKTLADVDFVAAEDTRVTLKLLNHLGIKKPLISYNRHNSQLHGQQILQRIQNGENCGLCTDAGTPAISDPGQQLVADAQNAGLPVVPIPAASAAITAVSVSGLNCARFVFEGFISQNKRIRAQSLNKLKNEERAIVIYEAPHKLPVTLAQLATAFGPQRKLTLCRELTKLHEEIWPTTLGEAAEVYAEKTPKGEFVLVIEGAPQKREEPPVSIEAAALLANKLAKEDNLSKSEAAKKVAAQTGYPKSGIYRIMQQSHNSEGV